MADWSMLPSDILGEIALKLDQLEDLVYFSVVCQSWNHASSLIKPNWNSDNVTPWLLLAERRRGNPDCYRKLYNITYNKTYQLKLPDTFGLRCWGSPFGWIVILTLDFHVHLLNPLTNVRITNFPCVLTLDDDPYEIDDPKRQQQQKQWYFDYFVNRLVVLKMPKHNNRRPLDDGGGECDEDYGLVVAVLYILGDRYHYLAIARPGDQAWTRIDDLVEDVVCLRNVIYILRFNGELAYCDMKRWCSSSSGDLKDDVKVVDYVPKSFSVLYGLDKVRVLDLCGDLLMVQRKKESYERIPYYETSYFNVFRLDNKEKKWVQIKDIGNYAIFVGNNTSMVVPISMANNCLRNSIYFTDDESMFWRRTVPGGRDMGVYNICSGDIIPFYKGFDTRSTFCAPIFFKPKC